MSLRFNSHPYRSQVLAKRTIIKLGLPYRILGIIYKYNVAT